MKVNPSLEQAVAAANGQQELINNATEQINNLYNEDGTVGTDLTLAQISGITTLSETIGEEVVRTELLAKASTAYETVTVRGAEKAEAARLAEEATKNDYRGNNVTANNSSTGNSNSSSSGSNSNDSSHIMLT